jgi:hypothetical protein
LEIVVSGILTMCCYIIGSNKVLVILIWIVVRTAYV